MITKVLKINDNSYTFTYSRDLFFSGRGYSFRSKSEIEKVAHNRLCLSHVNFEDITIHELNLVWEDDDSNVVDKCMHLIEQYEQIISIPKNVNDWICWVEETNDEYFKKKTLITPYDSKEGE